MTDAEIEQLIKPAFEKSFGHHGLEQIHVASGEDHDGEAALFITVRFGADATIPLLAEVSEAADAVDRLLLANGEARFAYTDFAFSTNLEGKQRLRLELLDLVRA